MKTRKIISTLVSALGFVWMFSLPAYAQSPSYEGIISKIVVGQDNYFGARFHLSGAVASNNPTCNATFFYTEPEAGMSYDSKVRVFTAAYLAGKTVRFFVVPGRSSYCKIVVGEIY